MEQLNNSTKIIYKQLSESERIKIKRLYDEGYSYSGIGKKVSRHRSTIMREIKRNGKANLPSIANKRNNVKSYRYSSKNAQINRNNRAFSPNSLKKYSFFISYVHKNLSSVLSLEHIRMNFKKFHSDRIYPTLKTIYNWCYKKIISYLWGGNPVKKQRKKHSKDIIDDKVNISQRKIDFGFDLNNYSHFGHFEIDTIYNGDKKGGVLTFNERKSRFLYAVQIPNRKATTINKALRIMIKKIGKNNIKSITSDNGKEFYYSAVLEASYELKWYYCDPYTSSQRGQNERLNRDVRKFFKKGILVTSVPKVDFEDAIKQINEFPRRLFKGLNSYEYLSTINKFIS